MENTIYSNNYHCPRCEEDWIDEWDCMCDDRCPNCNLSCSPVSSEEVNNINEL